jgi:hypothetical protein
MNGSNKLECWSQAGLSSLVECNTLAYWAHSKETKCGRYGPKSAAFNYKTSNVNEEANGTEPLPFKRVLWFHIFIFHI